MAQVFKLLVFRQQGLLQLLHLREQQHAPRVCGQSQRRATSASGSCSDGQPPQRWATAAAMGNRHSDEGQLRPWAPAWAVAAAMGGRSGSSYDSSV